MQKITDDFFWIVDLNFKSPYGDIFSNILENMVYITTSYLFKYINYSERTSTINRYISRKETDFPERLWLIRLKRVCKQRAVRRLLLFLAQTQLGQKTISVSILCTFPVLYPLLSEFINSELRPPVYCFARQTVP